MPAPLILFDNAADDGALAAPWLGDAAPANLLTERRSEIWRADGPATLTLEWSEPRAVDLLCLARTNLSVAAVCTLSGWDEGGQVLDWTGLANPASWGNWFGTGPLDGYSARPGNAGYTLIRLSATARLTRLEIAIDDPDTPIIEAARLIVGTAWQPAAAANWGMEIKFIGDAGSAQAWQSDAGDRLAPAVRHVRRSLAMTLPLATDDDRDAASTLSHAAAAGKMILVCAAPDASNPNLIRDLTLYGSLPAEHGSTARSFGLWSSAMAVTEF